MVKHLRRFLFISLFGVSLFAQNNALDFDGSNDYVSLGDVHDSFTALTFLILILPILL
ncbi:MAG: hypothetical protein HOL10_06250 [Candidatus Marinimicrobia bacterium]|jgi:hypothetical protein|nr:hypothetical protein [Candidatus Neomarinimicrobiota bacterium]MBT5759871.1 hypothetical protein [Candidatus Neomarinimicrobiota bacterium]